MVRMRDVVWAVLYAAANDPEIEVIDGIVVGPENNILGLESVEGVSPDCLSVPGLRIGKVLAGVRAQYHGTVTVAEHKQVKYHLRNLRKEGEVICWPADGKDALWSVNPVFCAGLSEAAAALFDVVANTMVVEQLDDNEDREEIYRSIAARLVNVLPEEILENLKSIGLNESEDGSEAEDFTDDGDDDDGSVEKDGAGGV